MAIREELRSGRFWRPVLAEAVGTLVLVGVVLGASAPAAPSPLQPALAGGLAAAALACCFGHVSGAQANPALTLAGLCARKLDAPRAAAYLLAQGLGALLAAGAFRLALPAPAGDRLVTRVPVGGHAGQALAMELFGTFQLALTIFAAEDRGRREGAGMGGLAVGCSLAAGGLAVGPFSGGSLNPARSLGPAIVTGIWDDHWVYWLGPGLGAVLGGLTYELLFAGPAAREQLRACLTCRDVGIVETTSASGSSLAGPRAPPAPGVD
ncbi:PREDICTED: lens fiber major intrinsic protein-like [Crocodylus porosus]|uniref:Aquaporin 14 n=1 Tax=Crocodylus porosus TaxID=8502 RepID=A0A7D3Q4W2_CROPO|nr:PREDICTED: lens fiber major intrinsic protein-like [Crocodylus porosus]QKE22993.1 aquaporin 14 [Crocodylus porosus]